MEDKPERGTESELGLMWLDEGTLGGEKHEAKKSFNIAAFSAADETTLTPSDRDKGILEEVEERLW